MEKRMYEKRRCGKKGLEITGLRTGGKGAVFDSGFMHRGGGGNVGVWLEKFTRKEWTVLT